MAGRQGKMETRGLGKNNKGFTIIELISIMVIIGILGTVVASRVVDDKSESIATKDVIKSHIRYAQIMAMKSNTVCGIDFNTNTYSLFRNNSTADKITLPGNDGTDFPISSSLGTASETIYFDLWGSPHTTSVLMTTATMRPTGSIGSLGITMTIDTGHVQ
jgi:type II secretory pathway pseudopilin PulG